MISIALEMDCIEYMKECSDREFDLCIADPWYGVGMTRNDTTGFAKKRFRIPSGISDQAPGKETFDEIRRISKNQIIWGGNYFLDFLGNCRAPIIWDKGTGANYFADGEFAWTSFKTGCLRIFKHQWCGCFKDSEKGEAMIHPCQKPLALYRWILSRFSKPGMKIFDPFLGSGASRIACHDFGLDFWGTEIDSTTFQNQEIRFKEYASQKQLFHPAEINQHKMIELFPLS